MSARIRPSVRVHPFTGLVIDADTWATAHDYHRTQQQLHLLTLHGSGIAQGLEILPTDPPTETVVVEPGVAIDDYGNVIVVPERQHLAFGEGGGTSFIVLDYVESIPPATADQRDTRARILEDFRLRVLQAKPESPALELARVQLSVTSGQIVSPCNPWAPGFNEIDSRFRLRLQAQAPTEITIGLMVLGNDDLSPGHLAGVRYLQRELDRCGLRPTVLASSDGLVPTADLIYLTAGGNTTVPPQTVRGLAERLAQGAWLFADPCGPGTEMVQSLLPLLGENKDHAARTEESVLVSHFVFGSAPPGAFQTRELIWGERILISPRDYACAWAGRRGDQVFQREQIRSALEFGTNVAFGVLDQVAPR